MPILLDATKKPKYDLILNLYSKIRDYSLYNNAFYLVLNHATNSLLGFIFWNIMTKYFSPEQVGIGSTLIAASGLITILANLGLGISLIRFIPEVEEKAGCLINSTFTLGGLATVIGTLIYLASIKYLSPELGFIGENLWLIILFLIFTVSTTLNILTDSSLIAGRSAIYVFKRNIFISFFKLPLPVFVFASLNGFGIFAGSGLAILIGNILSWLLFLPKVYSHYTPRLFLWKKIIRDMLPYSFANYIYNLFNLAPQYVYPLMVLNLYGPDESAYLWIAWMMSMVLAIIPSGVAQALFAEGVHNQCMVGNNGRRALALSIMLSVPAVGLMFLIGEWFLHFFGPGYAEHGTLVARYLVLAIIPQCINSLYITINQIRKRIYFIIGQTGAIAIIALGLGWWLLGKIGLPGVGAAYALAHLIVAVVVFFPLWRELNCKEMVTDTNTINKNI